MTSDEECGARGSGFASEDSGRIEVVLTEEHARERMLDLRCPWSRCIGRGGWSDGEGGIVVGGDACLIWPGHGAHDAGC
jgi:hypothetical protein